MTKQTERTRNRTYDAGYAAGYKAGAKHLRDAVRMVLAWEAQGALRDLKSPDDVALQRGILKTYNLMLDGKWRVLREIALAVGCSENSASARLRDLRKSKYGGHTVERERVGGGLHWYRLIPK